ncbi:MAG: molybdopterin molybdotransferase MoeA [Alphaproteobacteria bacterium]
MIPIDEALERILSAMVPQPPEQVALAEAHGRVLAEDVAARLDQPPSAVSAMDGYAVRAADVAAPPVTLDIIGEAPAGGAFDGTLGPGQAIRIFTGGPVPAGADTIVIQEDTERPDDSRVLIRATAPPGRHIRAAGIDFRAGAVGLHHGRALTARDLALAAAMNRPWLRVARQPRIALLATGDELVMPGDPLGPNQIISANTTGLMALVGAGGGVPVDLGIAPDEAGALKAMAAAHRGCDMLVTIGGASVGERDLVRSVLGETGFDLDFWKVAIKPGKPLIFGRIGETPLLGLPGNPVSALVCALLFLKPALAAMLGLPRSDTQFGKARLGRDLGENGGRQDYMRAALARDADGNLVATPFELQDSSVLSILARADCLVVRPPRAPAAKAGETVAILPLDFGLLRG